MTRRRERNKRRAELREMAPEMSSGTAYCPRCLERAADGHDFSEDPCPSCGYEQL